MSLLFCDSFDHYTAGSSFSGTTGFPKWTVFNSILTTGRNGQGVLAPDIAKSLPPRAKITVGFAYKFAPWTSGGLPYELDAINISRGFSPIVQFQMFPDGTLGVYAGNQLIDNPSFAVTANVWMYIGLDLVLSAGAGGHMNVAEKLYVNGTKISDNAADSNVITNNLISGLNEANYHHFGSASSGSVMDDVYILDGTVSHVGQPNAQYTDVGDVGIFCIFPRQDVTSNWTPSSGTTRFNLVNENPPDQDATYIFDDNIGDVQTFLFDLVATFSGQIKGAQMSIYARKDDEGSRAIVDAAGGGYVGTTNYYLGDSYFYHTFPYDVEPQSGAVWTPAVINAQDFGVKLVV